MLCLVCDELDLDKVTLIISFGGKGELECCFDFGERFPSMFVGAGGILIYWNYQGMYIFAVVCQ